MRQFRVFVKPGSRLGPLIEADISGEMTIYLREKAIDGKANKELIELIAKHLDVPKSLVSIVNGVSSRHKTIRVDD